jgi:hypothetical protein
LLSDFPLWKRGTKGDLAKMLMGNNTRFSREKRDVGV